MEWIAKSSYDPSIDSFNANIKKECSYNGNDTAPHKTMNIWYKAQDLQ